jgi:hypothetical protein
MYSWVSPAQDVLNLGKKIKLLLNMLIHFLYLTYSRPNFTEHNLLLGNPQCCNADVVVLNSFMCRHWN